jgi:hypothetical protein
MQFSKYANYFICHSSSVPSNVLSCAPSQFPDEVSTSFSHLELLLPSQQVDNLGNAGDKPIIAEDLGLSRMGILTIHDVKS